MTKTEELFKRITEQLHRVVVGQEDVLWLILVAFVAKGHVLLEGVPGIAKTLIGRTLAAALDMAFRRIQFTLDLMPSDIIGTNIFDTQSGTFVLKRGPIFTDILLADEINRTPPKTQSALLEAMEERQVTIDGERQNLGEFFTVLATQNPIEYEGTYALPEAQVDRFLFKVLIEYPEEADEIEILKRYDSGKDLHKIARDELQPVAGRNDIEEVRAEVERVKVEDTILRYITHIVKATRASESLILGASPRAGIALLLAGKVLAASYGRDYVIPDDVKQLSKPALRHRIITRPEAEVEGVTPDAIIDQLLLRTDVPR
jgi:MoxR-like ATPase